MGSPSLHTEMTLLIYGPTAQKPWCHHRSCCARGCCHLVAALLGGGGEVGVNFEVGEILHFYLTEVSRSTMSDQTFTDDGCSVGGDGVGAVYIDLTHAKTKKGFRSGEKMLTEVSHSTTSDQTSTA